YIIRDKDGKPVKDVYVNITINGKTITKTTDSNGKFEFNVGSEEGNYDIVAWKDCYERDKLTGIIIKPRLIVTCDSVKVNETLCCYVKDDEGNVIEGANVEITLPDGKKLQLVSDVNGKVCTNETQVDGDVVAIASKDGYKTSEPGKGKITKVEIVCPSECKCGCIEGTTKCVKPCCKGIEGIIECYWWLILLLIILLIIILLLFLLRKEKAYADEEFINRAIKEGKLEEIAKKFSKIYVKRKVYEDIQRLDIEEKIKDKFEFVDLDEKGEKYREEYKDEELARAKQLDILLLTGNDQRAIDAKDKKIKAKKYEEIL
ncbi:MAG: carboxypeptidase-like regulatory domain-containing protein, partial [Candidatus Altarchaeaceae archaeon]